MKNVIVIQNECGKNGRTVTRIIPENGVEFVFINECTPAECEAERRSDGMGSPFKDRPEQEPPIRPGPFMSTAESDQLLEYLARLLE